MQGETPSNSRQPPTTSSHRLQPLGRHGNRHSSMFNRRSVPNLSPSMDGRTTYQQTSSTSYPTGEYHHNNQRGFFQASPAHRDALRAPPPPSSGLFRPPQLDGRLPMHPFQLENTLSDVNRGTDTSYNRRNQEARFNPARRNMSGTSSRSSTGGGVTVSSGSSGSSTIGPATGRRKRLLSISSDGTAEARSVL